MAIFVWGLIIWREFNGNREIKQEPVTDPVHVTGSSSSPPLTIVENGTKSDSRLLPNEALLVFIIDDFGPAWEKSLVDGFIRFPADISLSIIPGNKTSRLVAESAANAGKEVLIHIPMEPSDRIALDERDMIWVKTSDREMSHIFDRALQDIPNAAGVNNHMGSKATAKRETMTAMARELKSRGLFFIDSRTSERSEGLAAMQSVGNPSLMRDVFLDVQGDSASVAARIAETARIARRRGWAIAIGHVKQGTLAALKASLPDLERQGFRLVSAGELIRRIVKDPS